MHGDQIPCKSVTVIRFLSTMLFIFLVDEEQTHKTRNKNLVRDWKIVYVIINWMRYFRENIFTYFFIKFPIFDNLKFTCNVCFQVFSPCISVPLDFHFRILSPCERLYHRGKSVSGGIFAFHFTKSTHYKWKNKRVTWYWALNGNTYIFHT